MCGRSNRLFIGSTPGGLLIPKLKRTSQVDTYANVVGAVCDLVDDNEDLIVRLERKPAGIVPTSALHWFRSDESVWDGTIRPAPLEDATLSWGVRGSPVTGGLIVQGGTCVLDGLAPILSLHSSIMSSIYLPSLPVSPQNNRGVGCGHWAVGDQRLYLGAFVYSAGAWQGGNVFSTPSVGGPVFVALGAWTPDVPGSVEAHSTLHQVSPTSFSNQQGATQAGKTTTGGVGNSNTGGGVGDNDMKPAFFGKGLNSNHFFTTTYFFQSWG